MNERRKCELTELAADTQSDPRSLALIECLREIDDLHVLRGQVVQLTEERDMYQRAFKYLSAAHHKGVATAR